MEIDDVFAFATRLLREYGLNDWHVKLGSGKKLLGSCNYSNKTIKISKFHIMHSSKEDILDTVKHEVAHAVVGPGHGHGPIWKAAAIKIGAVPEARSKKRTIPHRYELICDVCGTLCAKYDRMPRRDLSNAFHSPCGRAGIGKLRLVRL